jgi:hypothetical protein
MLCLFAAPLVALGLVRILAPLPQAAKASTLTRPESDARALALPAPSFWRWAEARSLVAPQSLSGSPFYLPTPLGEVADVPELFADGASEEVVTPVRPVVSTPQLRLTSILLVGDRQMAIIDGRTVKVGDEITNGWRLDGINARSQTVTVRHATGGEHVFGIWKQETGRP